MVAQIAIKSEPPMRNTVPLESNFKISSFKSMKAIIIAQAISDKPNIAKVAPTHNNVFSTILFHPSKFSAISTIWQAGAVAIKVSGILRKAL